MTGGDLYEDLGVPRDAGPEEIKAAHRKGVKRTHPDKGGDPKEFHALQRAYDVLSDPDKRARYDETGEAEGPSAQRQHAELVGAIYKLFQAVVNSDGVDLVRQDIRALVLSNIRQTEANIAEQVRAADKATKRIEMLLKRFKPAKPKKGKKPKADEAKAPPPGIIEGVLRQQLLDVGELRRKLQEAADFNAQVKAVFEASAYDFEAPPSSYDPGGPYAPFHEFGGRGAGRGPPPGWKDLFRFE